MNTVLFEFCAESFEAAVAAEAGGADRIELCSELFSGGITPFPDLIEQVFRSLTIPVYVLIRPRAGNFVFSSGEFDLMRRQIEDARQTGAAGVAIGVLLPDGRVDVQRTRELVELARPMAATFHRAFDETPDLSAGLEDVIETGANGLLTSGGAANVLAGAATVAALRSQAGERLRIIAAGGLRLETLLETVRRTGVFSLHGSFDHRNGQPVPEADLKILEGDIRLARLLLSEEYREQHAVTPVP